MSLERLNRGSLVPPWVRREHEERYAFAARFVGEKVVVDCACGEGEGSGVLVASGARRVIGIDLDLEAIRAARGVAASLHVVRGDAVRLPLRNGSAEVFVALETIEHLEDDVAFVAEAKRALVPGGLLICSTPNRTITNPGTTLEDRPFNPHHVREYSPEEFRTKLERQFRFVVMYGQVPEPAGREAMFRWLAWRISARFAARLRQATKLPRFLYDRPSRYGVCEVGRMDYEYLVAICTDQPPREANGA